MLNSRGLVHLIEARYHEVAESIEVPRSHKEAKDLTEDPNEATKLGKEVEDGVAGADVIHYIQVHLDCYLHMSVIVMLVWHVFKLQEREEVFPGGRRPRVQAEHLQVLRLKVRLLQLKRHNQPALRADRDVLDASFLDLGSLVKVIRVETNLGVQEDNEFALQPFERFFFTDAIVAL